jgi:hypothetical protein
MIIDKRTGSIMEKINKTDITSYDMADPELTRLNIKYDTNPNKYDKFITRSHTYAIHDIEYMYYKARGYEFVPMLGSIYLKMGMSTIEPQRVLGDNHYIGMMLRDPEVYHWKLSSDQMKNASIFQMSDGFDNHCCFTPNKLASVLHNPIDTMKNMRHFLGDTFLFKNGYMSIQSIVDGEQYIVENINAVRNKLVEILVRSNDYKWIQAVQRSYKLFTDSFELYKTDPTNFDTLITMIVNLATCIGSDDNTTLLGITFN